MDAPNSEKLVTGAHVPPAVDIHGAESHKASRFERLAMAGLAALAVMYVAFVIRMLPAHATTWDFSHYYASAMVLRDGGDPYTTDLQPIGARLGLQIGEINRGGYPPTFIWCFAPLTRLPVHRAFFVWEALNVACLVAGLILLMRETVSSHAATWLTLGVVFFAPVQLHLAFGQSQLIIFLMLVLVIRALEHSRDAEAGAILAAAALLRAFPIAMAGYLVVRRRWRALAWMAAGLAVGGALTVAAVGLKTFLDFRYVPALVTRRPFLEDSHQIALGSFISRTFWRLSDSGLIGSHESLRAAVSLAVCVVLVIFVMVRTWTHDGNPDEPDMDRRAYSLWIATMILISPTSWDHYLVLLLLPFIQITSAAVAGRVGRPAVIMCIASYILAEVSFGMIAWSRSVHSHSLLTTEMGFMAAATAWVGVALFAGTPARLTVTHPTGSTATAGQSTAI
jgi:alpha-1,2-mannosyltransferase